MAFTRRLDEAESDRLLRASIAEYEAPAVRLGMPLSDERVAMVSLAYNRGSGMLQGIPRNNVPEHPVMDAIRDGDRAEAWFQMRYNCWGSDALGTQYPNAASNEGGLRKRRYAEAQVLGLYDDPANVTSEEARNVYRMYQLHRDEIDRVERSFGVTVEGDTATRNRIAEANRSYPDLVDEYGRVQTIADALAPARAVLLRDLRREHPDLADRLTEADFAAGRIHLDAGRDLRDQAEVDRVHAGENRTQNAVRREQRNATTDEVDAEHAATLDSRRMTRGANPREIDSNDLLLGMGGNDTLQAHRGDDLLIGGAGRDRMEGGIGHDTYAVAAGDVVMDNDGRGELRWQGRVLTGGVRVEGEANTFRSADGEHTYRLDGDRLTISNRQGESLLVEHYAANDMGIRLGAGDAAANPPARDPTPLDRLSPQDRALYDRLHAAVQARGGFTHAQAENIAAAGLAEFRRRESVVREAQDIGIYGDRLFVSYFPHGRERSPNFHADVNLQDAARTPSADSLRQVATLAQHQEAAPARQIEPGHTQSGPGMGARSL